MKKFSVILFLLIESLCYSQSDSTYYFFKRSTPKHLLENKIKLLTNSDEINFYKLIYYCKRGNSDSIEKYISNIDKSGTNNKIKTPKILYLKAYYYNRILQNDSISFRYYNEALKSAIKIKDTLSVLYALSGLAQSYDYEDDNPYRLDYLNSLIKKSNEYDNAYFKIVAPFLKGNYYTFRNKDEEAVKYYNNTLKNSFTEYDSSILVKAISNLGVLYNENLQKYDSSLYYFKLKLEILDKNIKLQNKSNYFNTYLNLASTYKNQGNYDEALIFLKKADSIDVAERILTRQSTIKQSLSEIYEAKEDYKNALLNYKSYHMLSDSIDRRNLAEGIAKYDNQELRIKNLEAEAKRKQNQNIAIGLGGSLALGSIIAFLIFKDTKRKQKLAEKEKEIESQKLATVLKEQELTAIDAMIEGQEKERQRIANDLHDDLGGLMANVKLHFNALKEKDSPELFNKTTNLIEEAYQKVRTVAHAKNSGVIAKQGLLKAIKNMADKISTSNKIQIDVLDHNLDNRLENSLELTIFRIIQELTTNIIKHAEATEINIHITNHENSLNLMVEDNGKGFDTSQITKKSAGMGLSSIDKRVEHLEGNMTIESEIGQGTTVIIDIPL